MDSDVHRLNSGKYCLGNIIENNYYKFKFNSVQIITDNKNVVRWYLDYLLQLIDMHLYKNLLSSDTFYL